MSRTMHAPPAGREWTSAQQRAIAARSRTLVTAAAGSGKTSVLTELVAGALAAGEVDAAQVCAVTFTEKAAQEMRGRIAERLVELDARDVLGQLELARIGTIHSLCAAILRLHGAAVGVDPDVGQLDEAQHAWILRDSVLHVLDALADDPDTYWLRARMGDDRIDALLRNVYVIAQQGDGTAQLVDERHVRAILDPKTGHSLVSARDAARAVGVVGRLWRALAKQVDARKQALGRISFDDLERLAVEAVRIDRVRSDLRARWSMLLVDEFQDTNARQYELLDAIGSDRLFMVGDEWQSIYRFRGADVAVFRARRDDPEGGQVVPMRENFRSDAPVLDVVNAIFGDERMFGERYEPVVAGADHQRDARAPAVELLVVPEAPGLRREREAQRVAERVAQLVESGEAEPGQIALLYARGTGVDHYESALQAWGLPVLRDASSGFYDQRDVRDVLAVLALLRNQRDDHAALSVLAGPLGHLQWHELATVKQAAREQQVSLLEAARRSSIHGASEVARIVGELGVAASHASLVQLVSRVTMLPAIELGAAIDASGVVRLANLRRLVELADSAEQVGVRDVSSFLEFVAAQRRDARVGQASVADEHTGAVRLMTVHASKGLEFEHVFVVESASPARSRPGLVPASARDELGVVHIPLPRVDGRCVLTAELEQLHELDAAAEHEESLRLWYVAMTRAKHRLYVSGRWNFEPTKAGKPRAMSGALSWLRDVLELSPDLGGAETTSRTLNGLVLVDTHSPRRVPELIGRGGSVHVQLAAAVSHDVVGQTPAPDTSIDPYALRSALRDAVVEGRSGQWRQLQGTRLHDAVARLLDAAREGVAFDALLDPEQGPWLTDAARERLAPVVASETFRRLVDLGARSEVPYVARIGERVGSRAVPGVEVAATAMDVDAGRIDALAKLPDGRWWIVDWKTTLPEDPAEALALHAAQLERYAHVARSAGAAGVVVTLVPLDRPDDAVSSGDTST